MVYNDLPLCSKFNTTLYADDTVLICSDKNINSLHLKTNEELEKINLWFLSNKLSLNLSKTKYMLISNKPMLNIGSFSLKVGNTAITAANSIKYLGVLFDDKLNRDKHIQHDISELSSAIAILNKLKFYAPPSLLEKVYYGIVYPHLSYAITTWGNAESTRLNKIQVMQNCLVGIITKKCDRKTRMPLCTNSFRY